MKAYQFTKAVIPALLVVISLTICFSVSKVSAGDTCDSRFSWLPYENSAGYRIYYGVAEGGPYTNYLDVGNPAPVNGRIYAGVTGLTCGSTYYFVCTSLTAQGDESEYSHQVTVITPPATLRIVKQ